MAKIEKILLTGVAGFIGSHLADRFLSQGFEVVGVDNLSTGSLQNIAHLKDNQKFTFVKCDLVNPLPTEVTNQKYLLIANFACPASPPKYKELATETMAVSSVGVENLLILAKDTGARFFQASTSEVYGDPLAHPQTETYFGNVNSYGPRAMYDEGKRFAEALVWVYRRKFGVDTGIVRIFNTYGPRMDPFDGRVVSSFVHRALAGEPLVIEGDGKQTRSFCFVSDEVDGLAKLALGSYEGPVNLGSDKEFSVLALAELVNQITDNKAGIKFVEKSPDDPVRRKPDLTLAKKLIGWSPKVRLEEGIKLTAEWMEKRL